MRLLTRSDFDGLICAVLLKQVERIDKIEFVHPKDIQDGKVVVTPDDVLANIPHVAGCGLWFDHHSTEIDRVVGKVPFKGDCRLAPSAARVIFDHYGGAARFPGTEGMMAGVDRADSAQFTMDQILRPTGWDLLSFVMDARTGLGRFRDYRISNYQLMFDLIDQCARRPIGQILDMPDVQQRVTRYFEQDVPFRKMLTDHSHTAGAVVVTDLRNVDPILCGNRFLVYAMFPQQNCSIWVVNGRANLNVSLACGHSIVNRTCAVDVGALMRQLGGGGHRVAGTCQVEHDQVPATLAMLEAAMGHPAARAAA
jgi:nanoRNase/pAp phosphatase (c-di-AMP/oligoRNAs hydrolase)